MTGAAVRSVKSMKRVMRDGVPELTEEVKKGNLSIRQAEQIAALPKVEQNDAIAQATVRPDRALIQPPDKGGLVDPADDDDSPW